MPDNQKPKKVQTVQVEALPSTFTALNDPDLAQHSLDVSPNTPEESEQLPTPYLPIENNIRNYQRVISVVHNKTEHRYVESALLKIPELAGKINARLLDRASQKNEEDKEKITQNRAVLNALKATIRENPPGLLEIEPNINEDGSSTPTPECIELIKETLRANQNAVIIITTNTPACAKAILEMFPKHHVYYRYLASDKPFGDVPKNNALHERCTKKTLAEIPGEIVKRSPDGINPPALPALTPELLSPRSVLTGDLSPTHLAISSGLSTNMSPVSNRTSVINATSPVSSPKTPRSHRLKPPKVKPLESPNTPRESQPGCLAFWNLLRKKKNNR